MKFNFATTIKIWREQRGLSQQQASDRLNVARHNWQAWETGRACPRADVLISLLMAMNVIEFRGKKTVKVEKDQEFHQRAHRILDDLMEHLQK